MRTAALALVAVAASEPSPRRLREGGRPLGAHVEGRVRRRSDHRLQGTRVLLQRAPRRRRGGHAAQLPDPRGRSIRTLTDLIERHRRRRPARRTPSPPRSPTARRRSRSRARPRAPGRPRPRQQRTDGPNGLRGVRRRCRASTFSGPGSSVTTSTCGGRSSRSRCGTTAAPRSPRRSSSAPRATASASPRPRSVGWRSDGARKRRASSAPAPARSPPACAVVQACFKTDVARVRDLSGHAASRSSASYAARTGRAPAARADAVRVDEVAGPDRQRGGAHRGRRTVCRCRHPARVGDRRQPVGSRTVRRLDAKFDPRPVPRSRRDDRPPARSRDRRDDVGLAHGQTVCGRGFYPASASTAPGTYQAIDLTDPACWRPSSSGSRTCWRPGSTGSRSIAATRSTSSCERSQKGERQRRPQRVPAALRARGRRGVARPCEAAACRRSSAPASRARRRLVTGTWSGDLRGTWDGLENAVRSAQTAGLVGYSTWGSDIGGYDSASLTRGRLRALGAARRGLARLRGRRGRARTRRPGSSARAAMNGLRSAAILHYELFPYHYELARRASATGLSILRPLALQYPRTSGPGARGNELLVGPDLLAAPVTRPGIDRRRVPPGGTLGRSRHRATSERADVTLRTTDAARRAAALPSRGGGDPVQPPRRRTSGAHPGGSNDLFRTAAAAGSWRPMRAGQPSGTSAEYGSIQRHDDAARGSDCGSPGRDRETQVVVLGRRVPAHGRRSTAPGAQVDVGAALRARGQGWLVTSGAARRRRAEAGATAAPASGRRSRLDYAGG